MRVLTLCLLAHAGAQRIAAESCGSLDLGIFRVFRKYRLLQFADEIWVRGVAIDTTIIGNGCGL